ncbi:MAG: Cof-type HAD-IIB family hydrolase [Christensenellales bacterium]|jgi:Cof subfamily protein (haloacid dehalogenase superfamily)
MKTRLVAMDLDGTLLGRDKKISERNKRALLACEKKGVMMVLASGRSFESVRELALGAGLSSPIISSNGTRVDESPNGVTLLEDTFPRDVSEQVYAIMKESGIYFVCYGHGKLFQNNLDGYGAQRGVNKADAKPSDNDAYILEVVQDEARMLNEGLEAPYKYVAFTTDEKRLAALKQTLIAKGVPCSISSSWHDNIEVVAFGAGKGKALRTLRERYGLSREETMAFGDNLNDLEMLTEAGIAVAMENAVDEVKRIAQVIAPHHDESGVAAILEQIILGG